MKQIYKSVCKKCGSYSKDLIVSVETSDKSSFSYSGKLLSESDIVTYCEKCDEPEIHQLIREEYLDLYNALRRIGYQLTNDANFSFTIIRTINAYVRMMDVVRCFDPTFWEVFLMGDKKFIDADIPMLNQKLITDNEKKASLRIKNTVFHEIFNNNQDLVKDDIDKRIRDYIMENLKAVIFNIDQLSPYPYTYLDTGKELPEFGIKSKNPVTKDIPRYHGKGTVNSINKPTMLTDEELEELCKDRPDISFGIKYGYTKKEENK